MLIGPSPEPLGHAILELYLMGHLACHLAYVTCHLAYVTFPIYLAGRSNMSDDPMDIVDMSIALALATFVAAAEARGMLL